MVARSALLDRKVGRSAPEAIGVALLLALFLGLALSAVRQKSTTFDEISHLTIGYGHWRTQDYYFHPENGLPQAWASLPLLPRSWVFPSVDVAAVSTASSFDLGKQFFFDCGNDADDMLFRARAFMSILAAAMGLLVYAWSRQLFGWTAGLISLALFATCPAMLAHGPLVTADLAAGLFLTAALWALWRVLHCVSFCTVLASVLAMAGLFLCKLSAVIIVPVGLLLAVLRVVGGRPLTLCWRGRTIMVWRRSGQIAILAGLVLGHVVAVGIIIWAFFGFRYEALSANRSGDGGEYVQHWPEYLAQQGLPMRAISVARDYRLLPEPYLFGVASALVFSKARLSFFNGEHGVKGWFLFFPYCLLVKTAPPLLVFLGMAAAAGVERVKGFGWNSLADAYQLSPLLIFLPVYWCFAVTSNLNIGHRHLLPTYPAMYILAGGAVLWLRPLAPRAGSLVARPVDWRRAAVVVLCLVAAAGEAVWAWPHYLAYFNFFAGGSRNGYKHLVDSSLDWGQDLKGLARWLNERGLSDGNTTYLSYFGTADPTYYSIHATVLPSYVPIATAPRTAPLKGGTYCISATMLQGVYYYFEVFKGPWGEEQERTYRQIFTARQLLDEARDDPGAQRQLLGRLGLTDLAEFNRIHAESFLARLCAYWRQRGPDSQVGYSILIYQMTDAEVEHALLGPAPYERRP